MAIGRLLEGLETTVQLVPDGRYDDDKGCDEGREGNKCDDDEGYPQTMPQARDPNDFNNL